jgi:hypothetical protein
VVGKCPELEDHINNSFSKYKKDAIDKERIIPFKKRKNKKKAYCEEK